jgi:hypothetical protein
MVCAFTLQPICSKGFLAQLDWIKQALLRQFNNLTGNRFPDWPARK